MRAVLRTTVRALAAPGAPLGWLRRAALGAALPALVERQHLGELLDALDAPPEGAARPPALDHSRRVLEGLRHRRTTCLYRALAGFASARAAGDLVRLVIGVRVDAGELVAHAWLERDGVPVGEREDPRARYAVAFTHPAEGPPRPGEGRPMTQGRRDVILTELPDGTGVLLDLKSKFYFTLNRTGVAVWKLLEAGEPGGARALAEKIAARFEGASVERVEQDVAALLRELAAEGLIAPPAGA